MDTVTKRIPVRLTNRQLGTWGEDRAAEYLESVGYRIFQKNWRCRAGELDIIAYSPQRTALVAVEVKTRKSGGQVAACEAISARKMVRLRRLLSQWIIDTGRHAENLAIDLIAISLDDDGKYTLDHRESLA